MMCEDAKFIWIEDLIQEQNNGAMEAGGVFMTFISADICITFGHHPRTRARRRLTNMMMTHTFGHSVFLSGVYFRTSLCSLI